MNSRHFGLLVVACCLAACGGGPGSLHDGAYWQDQRWDEQLFRAVQGAIHYPIGADGKPIGDPVSVHAKVEFTYSGGKVIDPEMAQATGRPDLDKVILQQVATAGVPAPFGLHATEPHAFALDLSMLSPMEAFEGSLVTAINAKKFYPREAILRGDQGSAVVNFDYTDGKAANVALFKSSGAPSLDGAAVLAVSRAQFQASPAWLNTRALHLRIAICYSLNNSSACPHTQHVIEVVDPPAAP